MTLRDGPSKTGPVRVALLAIFVAAVAAVAAMYAIDAIGWDVDVAEVKKDGPAPPRKVVLGLSVSEPGAFQGYTLVAPMKSSTTYLLDMAGKVVKSWQAESNPALVAYLLEDGHLFRPAEIGDQVSLGVPGAGGRIQEFDWDGRLVWDYQCSDAARRQHHDAIKLPNGNVLMIVWDRKDRDRSIAAGRRPDLLHDRPLQADGLVEVKPTGPTTGEVVWEWYLWDHLIQDHDATKSNYGEVAAHPELVDLNYEEGGMAAVLATKDGLDKLRAIGYLGGSPAGKNPATVDPDWTHFNGLDYNPDLDQIVISVHGFSELWVVDHSTTTAQAAGHIGGRSRRGGDLLYRWGNPSAYRTGTAADRQLFYQHNAHWIPGGRPGAGNLLVFNNGFQRGGAGYSSIEEITPPADPGGHYPRVAGEPFGPRTPAWTYSAPTKVDFFSSFLSGAQRLPNGDTLICSGNDGTLFEVTPTGTVVWKYVNTLGGPRGAGEPGAPPRPTDLLPSSIRDGLDLTEEQRRDLDAFQEGLNAEFRSVLTADQVGRLIERRGGSASFARPGQLVALSTQVTLKLTPEQRSKIVGLQRRVDAKLDALLTAAQLVQFRQILADLAHTPPGQRPGGAGVSDDVPAAGGGPAGVLGGPPVGPPGGGIFRAYRYAQDYPGLVGRDLEPGDPAKGLEPKDHDAR